MPAALVLLILILVVLLLHVLVFEILRVLSYLLRLFTDVEESVVLGDRSCNGCRHCLFIVLRLFGLITFCQVWYLDGLFRLFFAGHDNILLLVWTELDRGNYFLPLFRNSGKLSSHFGLDRLKIRFY